MRKTFLLKQTALIAVLLILGRPSLNSQCLNPGTMNDWPGFEWGLDLTTNPSTIYFNFMECNPCAFNGNQTENSEICLCRAECKEYWDEWLADCLASCSPPSSGCNAACTLTAVYSEDYCLDECGELPDGARKTLESFKFETLIWTDPGYTVSTNRPADDYTYTTDVKYPRFLVVPTQYNWHGVNMSYCIYYQLIVNFDDGSCCYFWGSKCFYRG